MNNLSKKLHRSVLVTGATSGIGYELSRRFAQNGYNLVLVARNKAKLEQLAKELSQEFPIKAEIIPKDLAVTQASEEIFAELQSKSIHIDILVNNAGFNEYGLFSETNLHKELELIQVNLISLTCLTKLLLPGMLSKNFGKILNVGSTGSFVPGPLNAVYCATKAYVLSFSEAIDEELRGTGVTVTTLCPGATKTEFAQRAKMEDTKLFQGSMMTAKEVSEIGYHALMQGKTIAIPGCANKLTICSLRLSPRKMIRKMVKGMMSRNS